jgi:glycerophosphoryl diester phosphodiesterase
MSVFVLLILLIAYCFVRFFHNWRPDPWPSNSFKLPDYQIHRGYCRDGLQENTLESFREAARLGYSMIELDVQLSKDEIPIVYHDSNLNRLAHRSERVQDLTKEELKTYTNAPSLEEVLTDPKVPTYINIEIKSRSARDQRVSIKVAELVKKLQVQDRVIVSSFNPISLRILWKLVPNIPRALLATNDETDPDSRIYLRKFWLGGYAHAHMLNSKLLKRLSERKIPVAAWTVNDQDTASLLKNRGVVSIITDLNLK